jgi:putative ABC transport system permease protein
MADRRAVFFVTYLRRELRRRMRQAVFVALGLALGVGLVVTVAAASAGVKTAQSGVLSALYGVGTDVTVTGSVHGPGSGSIRPNPGAPSLEVSSKGPKVCVNGKCTSALGKTIDNLNYSDNGISQSKVAKVRRLSGVVAAAGGVTLQGASVTFPNSVNPDHPNQAAATSGYTLDGVDTSRTSLGPLSSASLASGHSFTAADADSDVAVLDSGYAASRGLKAGSAFTIDEVPFTVIGVVRQPQNITPPGVYIPLNVAQNLFLQAGSLKNEVNDIYVATASATDVSSVKTELAKLLPGTTVTTEASLASEITGSVNSAAKLLNDLGRWLSVLALIAAFAVACLLMMAAVARRVAEFGTLKALGWRTRRIVVQVLGESVVMGIAGAAAGVGLGFAGAAIIAAIAPKLSATEPGSTGAAAGAIPIGGQATQPRTVSVPLHPSVTVGVIVLAVVLAVAGALLAGAFGSWRIGRLRPADALSRVA